MKNSQIFFAIKHPTKGIVGDTAYPYLNEDEPDKVKIDAQSFYKTEEVAKNQCEEVWKGC